MCVLPHTIPYRTVPYRTVPYRTVPYRTVPCRTVPYRTVPYHTIPYRTIPYHTVPYHTIPYHTIPSSWWHKVRRSVCSSFGLGPPHKAYMLNTIHERRFWPFWQFVEPASPLRAVAGSDVGRDSQGQRFAAFVFLITLDVSTFLFPCNCFNSCSEPDAGFFCRRRQPKSTSSVRLLEVREAASKVRQGVCDLEFLAPFWAVSPSCSHGY